MPPLRERLEDIAQLARRFRQETARDLSRPVTAFSGEALARLRAHSWPGNVRELRNVVRHLVLVCEGLTIQAEHVERVLVKATPVPVAARGPLSFVRGRTLKEISDEAAGVAERAAILEVLEAHDWNQTVCARTLQVDQKTLYRKMRQFKIERHTRS